MKQKHPEKISVGITGQSGFIGTHLFNYLRLKEEVHLIPFEDDHFNDIGKLSAWAGSCDVIVHLAAMNRHGDAQVIYDTNIQLVKQLITALEKTSHTPHVLFASSIQEEKDNPYGKSKREGRELLWKWAERNKAGFSGLIIPNVFGPFGHPYYNSVVATFCHQLTHGETPNIEIDGDLQLIYVGELVLQVWDIIKEIKKENEKNPVIGTIQIRHTSELKVSGLLNMLKEYHRRYSENGEIPGLTRAFERNLFHTYLNYIDHEKFFPFQLKSNSDERGSFVETMKLNSGGQISFSVTKPGITRGNHFHTRKAERFAVIKGKARIQLRRTGTENILSFNLDGERPSFVDMPVWYTHKITNTGSGDLFTLFWINEHFDPEDADTYYEEV